MMIFAHGLSKLQNPTPFIEGLASKRYPAPTVLGYLAISAETLFPFLIILGLFTRISAVIAAGNMLVAGFIHHLAVSGDPFSKYEKALLYMIVFACIALAGAGEWSITRLFGSKS